MCFLACIVVDRLTMWGGEMAAASDGCCSMSTGLGNAYDLLSLERHRREQSQRFVYERSGYGDHISTLSGVSEKRLHCLNSRMTSLLTPISLLVVARTSSRILVAVLGYRAVA